MGWVVVGGGDGGGVGSGHTFVALDAIGLSSE